MAISEQGGYQCPACGYPTTNVRYTVSYESHITRKRECMKCGHVHETVEMRIDMMAVLNFAHQITCQHEAAAGETVMANGARA